MLYIWHMIQNNKNGILFGQLDNPCPRQNLTIEIDHVPQRYVEKIVETQPESIESRFMENINHMQKIVSPVKWFCL